MQSWGLNTQTTCFLCGEEKEKISLLHFNCTYTTQLILISTETLKSAIRRVHNMHIPTINVEDIITGDNSSSGEIHVQGYMGYILTYCDIGYTRFSCLPIPCFTFMAHMV